MRPTTVAALICGLCLVACSRGYRDPEDSAALEREIDDENVATRVRLALGQDPVTAPYAKIRVSCAGRVVTLQGSVDRAAVRQRAVEIARASDGVLEVRYLIEASH